MLTSKSEYLSNGRIIRFAIEIDSSPISYAGVIDRWQRQAEFREFFIDQLRRTPFTAFRWETPRLSLASAERPFEFVVVDSPELACAPDPFDFAEHFDGGDRARVVEFANLGGDAILVVPGPEEPVKDYGHLASFLANAPLSRQHELWRMVGAATARRLGSKPVWLSTAGGGVDWLHVRLDDRPKYYAYEPYRQST